MTRHELQKLARLRLGDAKHLLEAKCWSGAYYLAGYAVECALKACVPVRLATQPDLIFAERRFSDRCWTHSVAQLAEVAGLKETLAKACMDDPTLQKNWSIVKDWTEESRYRLTRKNESVLLYNAIADKKHGVLLWVKTYW